MLSAEFLTRNNTTVAAKVLVKDMSVNRDATIMIAEPMQRNLTALWNRSLKAGLAFFSGTAEPQVKHSFSLEVRVELHCRHRSIVLSSALFSRCPIERSPESSPPVTLFKASHEAKNSTRADHMSAVVSAISRAKRAFGAKRRPAAHHPSFQRPARPPDAGRPGPGRLCAPGDSDTA